MEQKFYNLLDEFYSAHSRQKPLSSDGLQTIIQELRAAKGKKEAKMSHEKHLLQRYEIVTVGDSSRLVLKKELQKEVGGKPSIVYVAPYEQLFDVINKAHIGVGHGGINITLRALTAYDVTRPQVEKFLKCCETCNLKVRQGIVFVLAINYICLNVKSISEASKEGGHCCKADHVEGSQFSRPSRFSRHAKHGRRRLQVDNGLSRPSYEILYSTAAARQNCCRSRQRADWNLLHFRSASYSSERQRSRVYCSCCS